MLASDESDYVYSETFYRVLRRLNGSGSQISTLSLPEAVQARALRVTQNGDLLVAGSFTGSASVAGGPAMVSTGSFDGYVARLSATFTHIWSTPFGGSAADAVSAVQERGDGSIVAVGTLQGPFEFGASQVSHQGGTDAMIVSLTSGGIPVMGTSFGGAGNDYLGKVAIEDGHDVVVGYSAGGFTLGSDVLVGGGGFDALVAKLSSETLTPIWARLAGGLDLQSTWAVGIDAFGRIAIAGAFRETLDFGTPLTSNGNTDAFLIQLSP